MKLVDNTIVLIFGETFILFSMMAAPSYTPTNKRQGFQFLHIVANTCIFYFCDSGHLTDVRWHPIAVLICIPQMFSQVEDVSCAFGVFIYLNWRNVYSSPLPVFKWDYLCCSFWDVELHIFWILNSYQIYGLQIIFSHSIGCLFTLLIVFFA